MVTIFTTLVVGARMQTNFAQGLPTFKASEEFLPFFPVEWALAAPSRLLMGIPFSLTLVTILLAHEMGHYLYCRKYHVSATLPFFIPAPTPIGTLGAVIRIKSPICSRDALFDIGIAGPIAGFVPALIALFVGLHFSRPLSPAAPVSDLAMGFPLIFQLAHRVLGVGVGSLAHINLHPVTIAAWVGMFATALNLLPSGQLDGGHIVYAIWPRAHRVISWLVVLCLAFFSWHYIGWRLWAALVAAMNILTWRQRQAPDEPSVSGMRWLLALLALVLLVLTFTVVPFRGSDLNWH
jgi:membrane-associated protease RseP (regulator of RpoE activity)